MIINRSLPVSSIRVKKFMRQNDGLIRMLEILTKKMLSQKLGLRFEVKHESTKSLNQRA